MKRSSVRLSVPSIDSNSGGRRFSCCASARAGDIYIDSGGRGRCVIAAGALCSNGAAARCSSANAGSVTLIAELRG